jgi:hypothetical protein
VSDDDSDLRFRRPIANMSDKSSPHAARLRQIEQSTISTTIDQAPFPSKFIEAKPW